MRDVDLDIDALEETADEREEAANELQETADAMQDAHGDVWDDDSRASTYETDRNSDLAQEAPIVPFEAADEADIEALPNIEALDGRQILTRLSRLARSEEDTENAVPALIARLEEVADPSLLPEMFSVLEDPSDDGTEHADPYGIFWSVFYVAENMDEAYLVALLDALPALWERAPGWAETALLRILNTRGEPEDCTSQFEELAHDCPEATRVLLHEILQNLLTEEDESLSAQQRDSIRTTLDTL